MMRPLELKDVSAAAALEKQWFGDHGATEADLSSCISTHPQNSLALVRDDKFEGFSTFEVVRSGLPKDYVGNVQVTEPILFIQQFTTMTNCRISDMSSDKALLQGVEEKARELQCGEIWVALPPNHPYSKAENPKYDTFGFYESHGYHANQQETLTWQPNAEIAILCLVFKKKL